MKLIIINLFNLTTIVGNDDPDSLIGLNVKLTIKNYFHNNYDFQNYVHY